MTKKLSVEELKYNKIRLPEWSQETCKIVAWVIATEGFLCIGGTLQRKRPSGGKTISPHIGVNCTSRELLEKFADLTGVRFITGGAKYSNAKWKRLWKWGIYRLADIHECARRIKPYLPIKVEQCELVIAFCESRLNRLKGKRSNDVPYSENELQLMKQCKILNHRGL